MKSTKSHKEIRTKKSPPVIKITCLDFTALLWRFSSLTLTRQLTQWASHLCHLQHEKRTPHAHTAPFSKLAFATSFLSCWSSHHSKQQPTPSCINSKRQWKKKKKLLFCWEKDWTANHPHFALEKNCYEIHYHKIRYYNGEVMTLICTLFLHPAPASFLTFLASSFSFRLFVGYGLAVPFSFTHLQKCFLPREKGQKKAQLRLW